MYGLGKRYQHNDSHLPVANPVGAALELVRREPDPEIAAIMEQAGMPKLSAGTIPLPVADASPALADDELYGATQARDLLNHLAAVGRIELRIEDGTLRLRVPRERVVVEWEDVA